MVSRPPVLTRPSRFFIRLAGTVSGWSVRRSWAMSLAMLAVPVLLEAFAGFPISLSFLYLAAAGLAVWCLGERMGLLLSIVTVVVGSAARHVHWAQSWSGFALPIGTEYGNILSRLLSIGLLALVVSGLRGALMLERWRACSDGLTGVLNKGAFEREMVIAVERARREDRTLVLAFMDLDGFKAVNDQFGHSAGDAVLRSFARGACEVVRHADLFARTGGDEFAALLSVPGCEEGSLVAEALHKRLSRVLKATGYDVTCSMGALVMASRDAAIDDGVMEQADALMYEAKRAGKNAFRVARGNPVSSVLRNAFPPLENNELHYLLERIDLAERRQRWSPRRDAA